MKKIGKLVIFAVLIVILTGCSNTISEDNTEDNININNDSEISENDSVTNDDTTETITIVINNKEDNTENTQKSETTEKDKKWVVDKEGYYEDVWVVDKEAWVEDVIHTEENIYEYCICCGEDITSKPNHHESFFGIDDVHANAGSNFVKMDSSWVEQIEHQEEGHWEQVWHEEEGHWE